jgi:O-antigen/teichoic acid export membrane protein
MPTSEATPERLRTRVLRGLAWGAASQVVLQISRIVVAVCLARLLSPHDYGVAAMVLVFSSLVLVFSDLGLGAALVQRREIDEDDRSTAWWTSVGAGVCFTLIGAAMAGPLAHFYGEPDVRELCMAFSITFLITSFGTTQESLLVREMRFRQLEIRLMVATGAGAVVGIAVALGHHGAWAIIAQQLTEALVSSILLWAASPWRPSFRYSRASLRSLWGFSGWLVGNRLLFYAHRNVDNILIGRFVGAAALGAYSVAYNVMLVPFSRIAGPIQRVLWPAFAEMQHDAERICQNWIRVTRILAAVAAPALAGLVIVAPDFVHVVLGDRWAAAIPLVQALAWVGILQSVQVLNVDILQARDRTALVFRYMVFFTIAHLCAFVVGLQWGVLGVAIAYAISSTLVEPVLTVITARELRTSPWRLFRSLIGVAQATSIMAVGVLVCRGLLVNADVGPTARLAVCIGVGAVLYALAATWRVPELLAELRGLDPGRRLPFRRPLSAEAT